MNADPRFARELFLSSAIKRAGEGDPRSVATLVERLTPALVMQASHRLGPTLRRFVEPEDVVNDVWLASLRRLSEFVPAEGRATASLLSYLGVAVLRRVHRMHKIHMATPGGLGRGAADPEASEALAELPAETTGVVSKHVRSERHRALHEAVAELDEVDRAVVVLRALEQHPNEAVAAMTGLQPNAVSQRLRRALAKLRERLPESVFDDLDDA